MPDRGSHRFVFPTAEAAANFLSDAAASFAPGPLSSASYGRRAVPPRSFWDNLLEENGGWRYAQSSHGKEQHVYGYQEYVHDADLKYLHERDGMVNFINSSPAKHTWFRFPTTRVDTIDDYFLYLTELGWPQIAAETDTLHRRDGVAFAVLITTGDLSSRLSPSERWLGFEFITRDQIDTASIVRARSPDPLLRQHGIESLEIHIEEGEGSQNKQKIHGSRLIRFRENGELRNWDGRPKILPVYDAVWNLRDIEHAQTHGQFEGNPIVVELVPPEDGLFELDAATRDELQSEIQKVASGAQQAISPAQGVVIKRLGPSDLPDPTHVIRLLVGKIARSVDIPANMLLPSSRGSEQVTDQDVMAYISDIDIRRQAFAFPILAHLVTLGKFSGELPSEARLPLKVEWPYLRTYNIREIAYAYKTFVSVLDTAKFWGRKVPPMIEELFPEDPNGKIYQVDPEAQIELEEQKIEQQREASKAQAKAAEKAAKAQPAERGKPPKRFEVEMADEDLS